MNHRLRFAAVSLVLVSASCSSGGGSQNATTSPANTSLATTEPPATTSPATTEPPATTSPANTEPPSTTVPSTVLATVDLLAGAFPTSVDLPTGWSAPDDPFEDFQPGEGNFIGNCGGPNGDLRAQDVGLVQSMSSEIATESLQFLVTLYAFAAEDDAAEFMARSTAQTQCPDFPAYEVPEGIGPGKVNLFTDPEADDEVMWTVAEVFAVTDAAIPGQPDAFVLTGDGDYSTQRDGIDYGFTDRVIQLYEQHGQIVVVSSAIGGCCLTGFAEAGSPDDDLPTFEMLASAMDTVRPIVLERLLAAQLL